MALFISESTPFILKFITFINNFIKEFEILTLYGTKHLSFNLHSNLHLPEQFANHDPLHNGAILTNKAEFFLKFMIKYI